MATNKTPAIAVTYEIVTPESAAQGDADDRGWETAQEGDEIEVDEYDIEEHGSYDAALVVAAVKYITQRGSVEPSSSAWHAGVWYTTIDSDHNYSTGADTNYSYHLRDFSNETAKKIFDAITAKR